MAHRFPLAEIRARTYKGRDAWWTVWLVDPVASRLVWLVSPWRWITPNLLTTIAFLLGLGAAVCYWEGSYGWIVAGTVLFHLSFVLDCMDGKIARLNGTGSLFGAWLDYVFDRFRVVACTVGLFVGQYARTGDFTYLWLTGLVIFLDMFRYLNALQMNKVRGQMKVRLGGVGRPAMFLEEVDQVQPVGEIDSLTATAVDRVGLERPVVDVYVDFRARFGLFIKLRNVLLRHRIRAHLFSGIEFMMFVFIVGPLVGQIVATTVISAALLVIFELLLILKLWMATKAFARQIVEVPAQFAPAGTALQVG